MNPAPKAIKTTSRLFGFLKCANQPCFDHVLKEFLCALNPATSWILNLPGIFIDVVETGRLLAQSKLYYGIEYFRILGSGGFGKNPDEVRRLIDYLAQLRAIDEGLSISFLKGYASLLERLKPIEIERYIEEGTRIFHANNSSGIAFMNGSAKNAENYIMMLSKECRLEDVQETLESLLKALVKYEVDVGSIGVLDSDELIKRGTRVVCMYRWLYLPIRVRHFETAAANRDWYMLMGIVSAAMLAEKSFCRVQGYEGYSTCLDITGKSILQVNLFQIIEIIRIVSHIKRSWPGAKNLLEFGFETEFRYAPPVTIADKILHCCLDERESTTHSIRQLQYHARISANALDTASMINEEWAREVLHDYPGLDTHILRTFSFIPDFLYPAVVGEPPDESLIATLNLRKSKMETEGEDIVKNKGSIVNRTNSNDSKLSDNTTNDSGPDEDPETDTIIVPSFPYDEWSQPENDYYSNYCLVHERQAAQNYAVTTTAAESNDIRRVRQLFELLKPEAVERERYLEDGDAINSDLLTRYLVSRQQEPCPRIDFYDKPLIKKRDLAVLVLLDISGSTSEHLESGTVLEMEKQAALVFGHGISVLGDMFAICGFSSNGRKKCDYVIYKSFEDVWNKNAIGRVLSAAPRCSTRIGPALRHSGSLLSDISARQRLIFLITDGKPQDTGYDPSTRYAQYDVRMANEENLRKCIYTFCISTQENSRADMEIMFPNRRFVILPDLKKLAHVLPQLYVRLTF